MSGFACFLPDEAMIHLRGNSVPEFLQGQLTCDTRKLSDTQALMGAYCNVKGRVLSDLTVVKVSDSHVILRLRRSLAKSIAGILQRYAQFSRISVDLDDSKASIVGVYEMEGIPSTEAIAPGSLVMNLNEGVMTLRRSSRHGELLSIDPEHPVELSSKVNSRPEAAARWAMETLRTGHYALEQEDFEAFTPQALGYDLTGLVAFDKGCYTGQEIVARLHYKGRSKKRLLVFEAPLGVGAVARDAPLLSRDGTAVGRCLRSESSEGTATLIAGEVQADSLNDTLFLNEGQALQTLGPDYGASP
ncbi:CAF17-like 4Fe-4S cluster assembly/insertion protein YgfZ [Congregibacter sp.]|uniref:CAF17-like 4Fe-4S cluster assembly/insertion protein YgfZ n=1 Tax=Congregibacter sp. TaxID=2744308 RepID=UPI003F6B79FB